MGPKQVTRVSVVTVCLNARDNIRLTIESVRRQSFPCVEHVIIDGASTDGTQAIISEYPIAQFVSEKDDGVYPAMEKGAKAATGDIVIFLNAGDTFFDDRVCEDVARFFDESRADIVFGNLMPVYLKPTDRHDHSAFQAGQLLDLGYMVNRRQLYDESIHHQATFYRQWVLQKCSFLCPDPIADGEYNLLLSAALEHDAKIKHIPRAISRFALGGISTGNFEKEWAKYVKARETLRNLYCPDPGKIRVRSATEFSDIPVNRAAKRLQRRIRAKRAIQRSFPFKLYDRLAHGITMRVVNAMDERFATLNSNFEQKLSFHSEQWKAALERQDQEISSLSDRLLARIERLEAGIGQQFQEAASDRETDRSIRFRHTELLQQNIARLLQLNNEATSFAAHGYKVSSQWDEDGLIQYLVSRLPIEKNVFIEIGTGDYTESNTRFLLQNNNWSGLIIDSRSADIEKIKSSDIYWQYSLTALCAFVERESINDTLQAHGFAGEIGLLSIDIDGVDWWLWEAITVVSPVIVVIEYNGIFGSNAAVTVPYDPAFDRTVKDPSWVYFGASLEALRVLGERKGYTLVGASRGGNNAFFVRKDALVEGTIVPAARAWVRPMFREARTAQGGLAFLDVTDAARLIAHKPVIDVQTGETVQVGDLPQIYD